MTYEFNDGWSCCILPCGEWRDVTLPHDAMAEIPRSSNSRGGAGLGWYDGCDVEYKREFDAVAGKIHIFEFEGVYRNAVVSINGVIAAKHDYGYTGFYVDATEYLTDGRNEITVTAHNSDQPNSRWYSGTGIYRPVRLHVLDEAHIDLDGIKIKTLSVSPPTVEVRVSTSCGGEAEVSIERCGATVKSETVVTDGECRIVFDMDGAELWSPENPALYDCRVAFAGDVKNVPFGIRTIACDRKNGFTVNGNRVILYGACVHHDNGILGARCYAESEIRKAELIKSVGYNAVRSAHNPCSKAFLDACDRLGLLVMDEYADMWYIRKNKYDYADSVEANYERDITDMINKDCNHPSVVMYSLGNEVAETGEERGVELLKRMKAVCKELDDRPVTVGVNIFFNYLYSIGLGQYSDKKAEKSAGGSGKKKVGSEFFNALAGRFGAGFMKTMAKLPGCDRRTRDSFAVTDIAGYNYGIKRYLHDLKKYPERVIVGSETFCADLSEFLEIANRHNGVIGDFVWAGIDYLGEAGVGAWEYAEYAKAPFGSFGWISAGSGRIDLAGNFLGEALYTGVVLGKMPSPQIAVVPLDHAEKKHSPSAWKFSNALPSWAWEGCDGRTAQVEVYARAHTVELYIDNKRVGSKKAGKNCRTDFKIKYVPGTLTAVAKDRDGNEISRTSLCSAGADTQIRLTPEPMRSDENIVYIPITYCDGDGVWKPTARGNITVTADGGELLALGNACPYNEVGFASNTTDTYYGRALAVVRITSDTARISASDGMRSAITEVRRGRNRD